MTEALKIPNKVWEADWTDDIAEDIPDDVGYVTYENEQSYKYIPQDEVGNTNIKEIKAEKLTEEKIRNFQRKIGAKISFIHSQNAKAA